MLRLGALRAFTNPRKLRYGSAVVGVGSTAYYASTTETGAGIYRQYQFWKQVSPVVFDYYWNSKKEEPRSCDDDGETTRSVNASASTREPLSALHERNAPRILNTMLSLKGLYVKLGQVLSVTALPVPEPYRVLFRTLQSDVPGWETFDDVVKPVLQEELGRNGKCLEDVFEFVDPIPCGAASIGQAHRARLLNIPNTSNTTTIINSNDNDNSRITNRDVIIKVQYPNAKWQVPADINCIGGILFICVYTGIIDKTAANLSFREFSNQFLLELDYENERRNLQTVYKSSLDVNAPYLRRGVVVPSVHEEYCTKKIITMSYLPGPKLEDEARRQLKSLGVDLSKGIKSVIKDATQDASKNDDPTASKTETQNHANPASYAVPITRFIERVIGFDTLFNLIRSSRRAYLLTQASIAHAIDISPKILTPPALQSWATNHSTAYSQAHQLSVTHEWIDALFDVHGHQIFNLGLFNADPHPGNILVIQPPTANDGTAALLPHSPKNYGTPNLGLIDYGQCKRLTPREQVQIAQLILSVSNNESDLQVATAFRNLGIETSHDSTKFLAAFARLMFGPLRSEHLSHAWHTRLHKLDHVTYFPKELSMVYRTSLLIRGLAVSLQINASICEEWKDHAQDALDRHEDIVQELKLEREQALGSNELLHRSDTVAVSKTLVQ